MFHGVFIWPCLRSGLTLFLWHDIPSPLHVAVLRIVGSDVSRPVEIVPAHAGNDMVLHHERRDRTIVELVEVADSLPPALLAGVHIEGDEMTIGGLEVQPVTVNAHAPVADMNASLRLPGKMPDLL